MRQRAHAVPTFRRGFTMVELLVVIAIIVLLVALLFVVGQPLRQTSMRTKCLVHQRSIALACQTYSTSNQGRYVSPRTDTLAPEGGMGTVMHAWVNCTQSAGTLINNVEQKGSLEKGKLWPYVDMSYESYRSPLDPTNRVRSYSLSSYIGVGGCDPNPSNRKCDDLYSYGKKTMSSSMVRQPSASMMVISEEDAPGYNRHGWVLECLESPSPMTYKWVDLPSFWDGNRVNIAMVDGSTKSLEILSPKLIKNMQTFGNNYVEPTPAPSYRVMRQFTLPGAIHF